jgi:hypothetical protein
MHFAHLCSNSLYFGPKRTHWQPPWHLHCFQMYTTKLGFQFRKQVEIRRGQVRRIWGMGKNFKAVVSCSSHRNLGCVSWRIVVQGQNALSQFAPTTTLTRDILTQTSQFVCIVRTVYGTTFLKIIPDYPKNWGHHLCWWHTLEFLRRGWASVLPLHAPVFFILDRSDGPIFHPELRSGR